jgi:hypothetical protein
MLGLTSQVKITEDSVEIDGHDITHDTTAVRYTHRVGEVPTLEVQLRTGANPITGEAVVRYVSQTDADVLIAEWLMRISPDDLEHEVLKRLGVGLGGPTQGEIYLEVLREWSSGA